MGSSGAVVWTLVQEHKVDISQCKQVAIISNTMHAVTQDVIKPLKGSRECKETSSQYEIPIMLQPVLTTVS